MMKIQTLTMSHMVKNHQMFASAVLGALILVSAQSAVAGGVALGSTRVIYPQGASQTSLAVTNTDSKNVFLIQSWISDHAGNKSSDFVITPPLFVIKPQKENTLRIMYVGQAPLPVDRESIYYLNSKAIPAGTPPTPGQNTLQIATQTVIKLLMRPQNLPSKSDVAPASLRCQISGSELTINNPSPYYVSLVNFSVGGQKMPNTTVPPKSSSQVSIKDRNGKVSFSSVNDYGVNSANQTCVMQ